MGYTIGNIYVITTVAVIGGALFGFDIASMSAMYVLILLPIYPYTSPRFASNPFQFIQSWHTAVQMLFQPDWCQ
jgi:hypothetical protein